MPTNRENYINDRGPDLPHSLYNSLKDHAAMEILWALTEPENLDIREQAIRRVKNRLDAAKKKAPSAPAQMAGTP